MIKSEPWAQPILRSCNRRSPHHILSTLLVRMPRIVLAEFNTHRAFSRNAASTRAIPTQKLIDQVINDPFIPLVWGKNTKGMQALGVHEDATSCEKAWMMAREAAVSSAERLMGLGLHKQIVGRILEPFMWTIVCVSATEWDNFLALRDHEAAEPHIAMLARAIRSVLKDDSRIQVLDPGQWHLPFTNDEAGKVSIENQRILSVARCASTSYRTVDDFAMTLTRATEIYQKLASADPIHASPFEHQATPDEWKPCLWGHENEWGNFRTFRQYRKMMEKHVAGISGAASAP